MRLFVCQLIHDLRKIDSSNVILDCCLTSINGRPRKRKDDRFFRIIEQNTFQHLLGEYMDYHKQSEFKYILHIEGHSVAYRLSIEMYFKSVILYVPTNDGSKLWYFDKMIPYEHYIPIEKSFDKEYMLNILKWCRENDELCEKIATNAREFAIKYLNMDNCLNYLEKTLNNIAIDNTMFLIQSLVT